VLYYSFPPCLNVYSPHKKCVAYPRGILPICFNDLRKIIMSSTFAEYKNLLFIFSRKGKKRDIYADKYLLAPKKADYWDFHHEKLVGKKKNKFLPLCDSLFPLVDSLRTHTCTCVYTFHPGHFWSIIFCFSNSLRAKQITLLIWFAIGFFLVCASYRLGISFLPKYSDVNGQM
jgi:hypothetical protein